MEQCKVYKRCGGCQLQNMDYKSQLSFKRKTLDGLLSPFCRVEGIKGMNNPCHYRNKVQAAFYYDIKRRKIQSGIYQSTSQSIVPIESCMLEDKKSDEIIQSIKKLAQSFKLMPYDIRKGTGFLRHVMVRRGFKTNEIMVVIVSATPVFPARNNFVKALLKEQPEITTIIHNINKTDTNLFITEDSRVLYGKGYIEDILCGKRFRISPSSFYQVNPVQCEVLYNTAMEFAGLDGTQTVFDAYCGTGTIGLIASDKARQVLGVELNKEAVRDAISNARLNSIKNCYFKCADAGEFIDVLVKENERFDVAFLDPPRAGSTPKFLSALIRLRPERIVYISCNPQTLARDLKQLSKAYKVKRIQGVDMFPFTKHIEAVALLEKR